MITSTPTLTELLEHRCAGIVQPEVHPSKVLLYVYCAQLGDLVTLMEKPHVRRVHLDAQLDQREAQNAKYVAKEDMHPLPAWEHARNARLASIHLKLVCHHAHLVRQEPLVDSREVLLAHHVQLGGSAAPRDKPPVS